MVDPSDPLGIESAVRRVLIDTELQHRLATQSATQAHRFRWGRVVADHREIYFAAVRAGRERRARGKSYASQP
jgi:hypothetical protein